MIYLVVAILSMSAFMLGLKHLNVKSIPIPQAIMTNYALALAVAVVSGREHLSAESMGGIFTHDWWYLGVFAGICYFASMDIMAASTRRAGVSVTTIASRCALIIPILWSFAFFGESVTGWQWAGIALVLASFFLIFRNRRDAAAKGGGRAGVAAVLMPLSVFLIMGIITVTMKSTQHAVQQSGNYAADYPLFEILIFASALTGSVIYYALSAGRRAFAFDWRSMLGGLCLGTFNYLITIGIMHGLRFVPTSVFYALYNICVVVITTLAGIMVFREKPGPAKIAGICLAAAAIGILTLMR